MGVDGGASKMRPSGRRAWTVSRGEVRRIEDIGGILAELQIADCGLDGITRIVGFADVTAGHAAV